MNRAIPRIFALVVAMSLFLPLKAQAIERARVV